MKALVCEMCSSHDFIKDEEFFVCQSCGTKYTVEAAKKLMIEGTVDVSGSSVKIDQSSELDNLYTLAQRARDCNQWNDAAKYYEQILLIYPNSWEAIFYSVYCKAILIAASQISESVNMLCNAFYALFNTIKQYVNGYDFQLKVMTEISNRCMSFSDSLIQTAYNQYCKVSNQLSRSTSKQYIDSCIADAIKNIQLSIRLLYMLGDQIEVTFDTKFFFRGNFILVWKKGVNMHMKLLDQFKRKYNSRAFSENKAIIQDYASRIGQYDPSYALPEIKRSRFPFHL